MQVFYIMFVFGFFKYTSSQFLTIGNTSRKTGKSACDPSAKSSLVEHFFNIIFTEFHNTPPVCVCVQMCPEQPTYCYPNGCLRRTPTEKNKKLDVPLPVTRVSENTKPIFFIDEKNDFMNDFLSKNYLDDAPPASPTPPSTENTMIANMRPDPFKDRYKILFKYKKMPKVELKYNLGEQVKNMKSDMLKPESVDVSNTRWPVNKIDRRLGGKRKVHSEPPVQKGSTNPRYFMSMFPDKHDIASYPPKYYKRELANNTHNESDGVDIKAIYVVGKSESESNVFSLEKLIDSLIESSFDNNITTTPEPTTETMDNNTVVAFAKNNSNNTADKTNSNKRSMKNETMRVISMNLTNENIDKNKYSDDGMANSSLNMNDMIATLSKRIEIQNNTSLEMMRRITGDFEFESLNTTTEKPIETTEHINNEETTTEYATTMATEHETRTTRKIKQRIVRRLHHTKTN